MRRPNGCRSGRAECPRGSPVGGTGPRIQHLRRTLQTYGVSHAACGFPATIHPIPTARPARRSSSFLLPGRTMSHNILPTATASRSRSTRSGAAEIWKCDSDGSNPVPLTSLGGHAYLRRTLGSRWEEHRVWVRCRGTLRHLCRQYRGRRGAAPSERSVDGTPAGLVAKRQVDLLCVKPQWRSQVFQDAGGRRPRPGGYGRGGAERWSHPTASGFTFAATPTNLCGESRSREARKNKSSTPRTWVSLIVIEDGVYFIPPSTPEAGFSLQFLRLPAGAVEPIYDFEREPLGPFSVAPGGRSILFGQMEPLEADIMLVENFR